MYYLTVIVLPLPPYLNQENYCSLSYRTPGLVNLVLSGTNYRMCQVKTVGMSPYQIFIFNAA